MQRNNEIQIYLPYLVASWIIDSPTLVFSSGSCLPLFQLLGFLHSSHRTLSSHTWKEKWRKISYQFDQQKRRITTINHPWQQYKRAYHINLIRSWILKLFQILCYAYKASLTEFCDNYLCSFSSICCMI